MTDSDKRPSLSDRPPEDLKKERDAFIQQFFRKGVQLTEELLHENDRLRQNQVELQTENARLKAQLASDDAIRNLLAKIEQLETEKQALLVGSETSLPTDPFSSRYAEVETELSNLAGLYIATSQLHGAHSVRGVLRNLKELLAQLVGAAAFAVYLASDDRTELVCIASEGVDPDSVARVSATVGVLGETFALSEIFVERERDVSKDVAGRPAAIVPLFLDGATLGVLAVFHTLPQRTEFGSVDDELFRLLSSQVAPALVKARLFVDAERKAPSVRRFVEAND